LSRWRRQRGGGAGGGDGGGGDGGGGSGGSKGGGEDGGDEGVGGGGDGIGGGGKGGGGVVGGGDGGGGEEFGSGGGGAAGGQFSLPQLLYSLSKLALPVKASYVRRLLQADMLYTRCEVRREQGRQVVKGTKGASGLHGCESAEARTAAAAPARCGGLWVVWAVWTGERWRGREAGRSVQRTLRTYIPSRSLGSHPTNSAAGQSGWRDRTSNPSS